MLYKPGTHITWYNKQKTSIRIMCFKQFKISFAKE